MKTGETSRNYLWWEAITTSRTEGTTGVKYIPSPVKSELCSEAIFMEGQNYSQDIKAGKEERRNILIFLPLPCSFSSYEYPLLAGPNCRSSQPGSLGDAVTSGQFLWHRTGQRREENWEDQPSGLNHPPTMYREFSVHFCLSTFWLLLEITLFFLLT